MATVPHGCHPPWLSGHILARAPSSSHGHHKRLHLRVSPSGAWPPSPPGPGQHSGISDGPRRRRRAARCRHESEAETKDAGPGVPDPPGQSHRGGQGFHKPRGRSAPRVTEESPGRRPRSQTPANHGGRCKRARPEGGHPGGHRREAGLTERLWTCPRAPRPEPQKANAETLLVDRPRRHGTQAAPGRLAEPQGDKSEEGQLPSSEGAPRSLGLWTARVRETEDAGCWL